MLSFRLFLEDKKQFLVDNYGKLLNGIMHPFLDNARSFAFVFGNTAYAERLFSARYTKNPNYNSEEARKLRDKYKIEYYIPRTDDKAEKDWDQAIGNILARIMSADPTTRWNLNFGEQGVGVGQLADRLIIKLQNIEQAGKYSQWILNQILKDKHGRFIDQNAKPKNTFWLFLTEDWANLYRALEVWDNPKVKNAIKASGETYDINKFNMNDLYTITEKYEDLAREESKNVKKRDMDILEGSYEENTWKRSKDGFFIAVPKTKEAASHLGSKTRWCTAVLEANYFENYSNDGPIFIIANGPLPDDRYQIHIQTEQFMNTKDIAVPLSTIFGQEPPTKQTNKIVEYYFDKIDFDAFKLGKVLDVLKYSPNDAPQKIKDKMVSFIKKTLNYEKYDLGRLSTIFLGSPLTPALKAARVWCPEIIKNYGEKMIDPKEIQVWNRAINALSSPYPELEEVLYKQLEIELKKESTDFTVDDIIHQLEDADEDGHIYIEHDTPTHRVMSLLQTYYLSRMRYPHPAKPKRYWDSILKVLDSRTGLSEMLEAYYLESGERWKKAEKKIKKDFKNDIEILKTYFGKTWEEISGKQLVAYSPKSLLHYAIGAIKHDLAEPEEFDWIVPILKKHDEMYLKENKPIFANGYQQILLYTKYLTNLHKEGDPEYEKQIVDTAYRQKWPTLTTNVADYLERVKRRRWPALKAYFEKLSETNPRTKIILRNFY